MLSTSPSRQDRRPAGVDCTAAPTEGPIHHALWFVWTVGIEVGLEGLGSGSMSDGRQTNEQTEKIIDKQRDKLTNGWTNRETN